MTKFQQDRINELLPLIKVIREKCIECCNGSSYEVKLCPRNNCSLFHYRLGLNSEMPKSTPKKDETDEKGTIREERRGGYTKNSPQSLERTQERYIKKNLGIGG